MGRLLAIIVFGGVAIGALSVARAQQVPAMQADQTTDSTSTGLPALPPPPLGKTTVIGGEIHSVDAVRDQFTLDVFGSRPMKMLFDARTQLYRDGKKIAPGDLHPGDRASVETVLDGTNIFAVGIHMLSRSPEGECQGQVVQYNPGTRELTVSGALSREPIKLLVPAGTLVVRQGQGAASSASTGLSDLVTGSVVSVKFESDNQGRGIARQIAVLATPGSTFVFSGKVSFLDLDSGLVVLIDPRDGKSYQVSFDPAHFPSSRNLHQGDHVTVTARFDGSRYVASAIGVS